MKIPVYTVQGLEKDEQAWGRYIGEDQVIELDEGLVNERPVAALRTLFHELKHALNHRSGLTQTLSDAQEEVDCETFANFMVDNFSEQACVILKNTDKKVRRS